MSISTRLFDKSAMRHIPKSVKYFSSKTNPEEKDSDEFRVLNLRHVRGQTAARRRRDNVPDVLPPRHLQMPVDQDWGSVWPGPRTFHPATVPLPIRQGFVEKGAPPGKFANAELMKIPNFLHLTPPVVKRQCEALKKFCTPWPKQLTMDAKCEKHFPVEITSSNYCHSSPTIRDPMARIVTLKIKLSALSLDKHARDKFLRLVGDRYDEKTDTFTIVTDRCPTRKQNYEYALYLLTAVYHESCVVEQWESTKSEADMEHYDWGSNASKKSLEALFGKSAAEIEHSDVYSEAVGRIMNEGESEYTVAKYGDAVRKLLNQPKIET